MEAVKKLIHVIYFYFCKQLIYALSKMPLNEFVNKLFTESTDSLYFNRLIYNAIKLRNRVAKIHIDDVYARILITGEIQIISSGKICNSLVEFSEIATGNKINLIGKSTFKRIYITNTFTLWRMVCAITEKELIEFFDQHYRTHLMYTDLTNRIDGSVKNCDKSSTESIESKGDIVIKYNDSEHILTSKKIKSFELDIFGIHEVLSLYESGRAKNLYYKGRDGNFNPV